MSTNGVRSVWGAALLVVAALFATAHARQMPAANAVKTSLLEIVDTHGKVRATLGFVDADQAPELAFLDPNGVQRLRVGLDYEGSPFMWFLDEHSKIGVDMSLYSPVVMTKGDSHPGDARISLGKNGQGGFVTLTTETVEGKSFGRISLMDSSNSELFRRPERR